MAGGILKKQAIKLLKLMLFFLDRHPSLRRYVYYFICKYGLYNFLKKFYASRLQQSDQSNFSPLMIGPVVILDLSEKKLTQEALDIYHQSQRLSSKSE